MHSTQSLAPSASVFLVEDSHPIRQRLEQLLGAVPGVRMVGYADRADEALERIVRLKPDAVVLDLTLAHGSGLDVLRALSVQAPDIAVFVLTNIASEQYRRLCVALGAKGFFDKTTEFEKVRDAIAARAVQCVH